MQIIKSKNFSNSRDLKIFYDTHGWVSVKNQLNKSDLKLIQKNLNIFFYKHTKNNFNKSVIYLNRKMNIVAKNKKQKNRAV